MRVSKIEEANAFKDISGIEINDINSFFHISFLNQNYFKAHDLLVDIIDYYGSISVVGFGEEYNPYNKSQLMLDKIGFFGQNDFKGFSIKNKINLKIYFNQKKIYFSHYVGNFFDKEVFNKIIHNYTNRLYLELINIKSDFKLILKENYIGVNSKSSIRLLFGYDLNENLYLIFLGDDASLNTIRNHVKLKFNFDDTSTKKILHRIAYLEKNFIEVKKIFNILPLEY